MKPPPSPRRRRRRLPCCSQAEAPAAATSEQARSAGLQAGRRSASLSSLRLDQAPARSRSGGGQGRPERRRARSPLRPAHRRDRRGSSGFSAPTGSRSPPPIRSAPRSTLARAPRHSPVSSGSGSATSADASGHRYHVPTARPRIPAELRPYVTGVVGLSNRPVALPADLPHDALRPDDAAIAYDLAPLRQQGIDGTGESIAVVSLEPFPPNVSQTSSDVSTFRGQFGARGPVTRGREGRRGRDRVRPERGRPRPRRRQRDRARSADHQLRGAGDRRGRGRRLQPDRRRRQGRDRDLQLGALRLLAARPTSGRPSSVRSSWQSRAGSRSSSRAATAAPTTASGRTSRTTR